MVTFVRSCAMMLAVGVLTLGTAKVAMASEIDLDPYVNNSLSTYYEGNVYPPSGGTQIIGGITFNLSSYSGGGTGVIQAAGGRPDTFVIPIEEVGVTTVYTIANSAFGTAPYTIGSLTFAGSDGAIYVYNYTEGDNIRDHATVNNNDLAPNIYATKNYGDGDHLDVQKINLPDIFADQVLTEVTFTALDMGDGDPFLAGITTSNISAAPEPSSWLMLIFGIGGIGLMLRFQSCGPVVWVRALDVQTL